MKAKKRGLSFIDKILLCINFFLCASLLLSYLAPITDPAKHWQFAFFGLAYPILLLLNVLFIVYWLLRKSTWALLPLICIAIGWNVLCNNVQLPFQSGSKPASGANVVRMMTYNVHEFKRFGSGNDISTKHDILQIIAAEQPDVIGMQEFYNRRRGQYAMVDSIKTILKATDYYFVPLEASSSEAIGMAMFSKYPIMAHGIIRLSEDSTSENQCLYIDVKKGSQTFRVYSVHLQSIRFDPKDYTYLDNMPEKTDMGSTKRLGSKLKLAFIKRSAQVFKIKDDAAKCPYPYIISGDFNDTPTSFAVNQMSKGLKNAFREKGSGLGRTYNGDFPNYQIDYIMASPAFDVASYQIIEKKLSDHYPVCSDLLLLR